MASTVEIKGMGVVIQHLEDVANGCTGQGLVVPMRKATMLVTSSAKKYAPVDTGRLRSSIAPEIRPFGDTIEGIVGTAVKYGPAMEFGTDPHYVPLADLEVWARRHDTTAIIIQRAIAKHGTRARMFLQSGFEDNTDEIDRIFEEHVKGLTNG